ncbi:hypothetical protein AB7C87_23525 [Natrarchaeobius sp. A-rgal3]|uniref:hypothetical protein n=1 Tax=Natrarchaeobius versutus TaxID=1679078 RepID=UPI0035102571
MVVAVALAMGMGGMGTAAAIADDSTETNETDAGVIDEIRGLLEDDQADSDEHDEDETDADDSSNLHSILERTDAENASYQQVETVDNWATDEKREELSDDEREELEAWLAAAPDPDDRIPEYVREIDSETYITGWEFTDGQFVVHIFALEPTTVTMAESADWEEGSGEYRTIVEEIDDGENTVYVDTFAGENDGVALSFATQLSMEEQRGPYISTGTQGEQDPFRHFGGTSGLFSGVAMTTGLAALGAVIVVRSEESGVVKA